MHMMVVAFWGAFFGAVALMLAGSLAAFARSLHRVALAAALSAVVSALFVVAYLGLLPIQDPAHRSRFLAHVAMLTATVLSLMLLAMLGLLRNAKAARRVRTGMVVLALVVLALGWLLDASPALALSSTVTFAIGAAMLLICVRSARRGDRLAWVAVSGVSFMLVAVGGLSWIALDAAAPWQVHAVSAIAGMAYLSSMATALWIRYSYLIELREVVIHGPSYDPITRMRSHAETGQMVGLAFFRQHEDQSQPVGVIGISIGNLDMLEKLHGRPAANHALFVCASRLRRCVPADVEMGRLGEDGFLLLARASRDPQRLVNLARIVAERLARPVKLSTSGAMADLEEGQAHWVAQVGVGVLATAAQVRPSAAVSTARAMSRTAWSYASRVAWRDESSGQIAEVPAIDSA